MSYPIDQLPDISSLGGTWTIDTTPDAAYARLTEVGVAHFPGHEWPQDPRTCTSERGSWYLDGTLLLCDGCGSDGT